MAESTPPGPLFDSYVIVDWSGGNGRKRGAENCLWIAHGRGDDAGPTCISPASRTEAVEYIADLLVTRLGEDPPRRLLVGFDFAFACPAGLAAHLPPVAPPGVDLPWRRVWAYVTANVRDDLATRERGRPTNRSNRFEVADRLNASISRGGPSGPFWCKPAGGAFSNIPKTLPARPFRSSRGVPIADLRLTDAAVGAGRPFRLYGHGSVGSQMLVGVPRLNRLREAPGLKGVLAVWPFETGWAPEASGVWPSPGTRVVLAEIYPSLLRPCPDAIKDRGQVRRVWAWARDLDRAGSLRARFAIPAGVRPDSDDDRRIRGEEGWILH